MPFLLSLFLLLALVPLVSLLGGRLRNNKLRKLAHEMQLSFETPTRQCHLVFPFDEIMIRKIKGRVGGEYLLIQDVLQVGFGLPNFGCLRHAFYLFPNQRTVTKLAWEDGQTTILEGSRRRVGNIRKLVLRVNKAEEVDEARTNQ